VNAMFKDRVQWFLKITTSNVSGKIGSIIVFGFIIISLIVAVGGTSVCPYNPIETNVGPMLGPPSWSNFFGTDRLGRDLFSRVLYATPNALFVSVSIIGSALLIGVLLGSFSAYHGGIIDDLLMRITDLFFALPGLIMSIAISVYLGPGIINMMYALMMFWWPAFARMARGEALRIAQFEFIEAARAAGLSSGKIVLKHILFVE